MSNGKLLALLTSWLWLQTGQAGELLLEMPDLGSARHPSGIVIIPAGVDPASISKALIHIPAVRNAKVYTKVNTLGVGMIQTLFSRKDELVSRLDLAMHAGKYSLQFGTNILEIKVLPTDGANPIFGRWALITEDVNDGSTISFRRSVIQDSLLAKRLQIHPLEILTGAKNTKKKKLTGTTTSFNNISIKGTVIGGAPSTYVIVGRKGLSTSSTRAIQVAGKKQSSALGASFIHEIGLMPGPNDIEVTIYDNDKPLVAYEVNIVNRPLNPTETFPGGKWAVVIGISDYKHDALGIPDLNYAAADAEMFRDFLLSRKGGGFDHNQIKLLTNEEATAKNIRTALFNFLAKSGRDDMVMVYFAGHGSPDPINPDNYYLLAYDTIPDNMGGTAIAMWDLRNLLDFSIRAGRAIVFADACHSGSTVQASGFNSKLNFVNKYLENLATQKGRMVITASRANEYSYESPKWGGGHGVFTHSLVEGLMGKADQDGNKIVNVREILEYLDTVVPRETADRQHISYRRIDVSAELPISQL